MRHPLSDRPVAVTGLGVVSPIGVGWPAFRDGLLSARSGTGPVTQFDASTFPCRVAAEVKEAPETWRTPLPAHELRRTSRATRMALAAAMEALDDAGLDPAGLEPSASQRFGVWVGTGGGGAGVAEEQYGLFYREGWLRTSPFGIVSALPGMISSDLSTAFGARGPSHVLSTGCTSSSDALGYAAQAIALGQVDRALVGGTEAPLVAGVFSNFCRMRAMSLASNDRPEAASRPFSADRDGFVLGEGAWFVLLEAEETAAARGAAAWGRLAGHASTCDAHHRTQNHPSGSETARAVTEALAMAGLAAGDVGYVNLHGSATPLNDRIETAAMKLAFGPEAGRIPMSGLKSQVGHPQGASGAAGLVATLLGMAHGFAPPTINLRAPDPECDLDYVPLEPRAHAFRAAVVNAISFGSKNSALVVTRSALAPRAPRTPDGGAAVPPR